MTTLFLVIKNVESEDKAKHDTFYSNSEAETIINERDIDDVSKIQSILQLYQSHKNCLEKVRTGLQIQSLIIILVFQSISPLAESSYIKLSKELDHPRKGLINIQNIDDNECFKCCLVRYLNPADRNPARMTKADKNFDRKLDFKNIKFSVKVTDIYKIEKKEFHSH